MGRKSLIHTIFPLADRSDTLTSLTDLWSCKVFVIVVTPPLTKCTTIVRRLRRDATSRGRHVSRGPRQVEGRGQDGDGHPVYVRRRLHR